MASALDSASGTALVGVPRIHVHRVVRLLPLLSGLPSRRAGRVPRVNRRIDFTAHVNRHGPPTRRAVVFLGADRPERV